MKKSLLVLASVALLFAGCAKEKFADKFDGGMTSVTFTANVDGGVATKAVADGDGIGANVNRCIMEIYFGDELYIRKEEAATGSPATATFSNIPVVAGKQYQILFWADCGGESQADMYYTTASLNSVTVAKDAFCGALAAGENDKLDAFCLSENYTVPQAGGSYTAILKRPFAQLNVITTDVAEGKTVTSADLLPDGVSVSYTAANVINVATGEISGSEPYAYVAPVYGDKSDWSAVKTRGEFTLSMDYLLASAEKEAIDVTFKTLNGTDVVMSHSLANLPYQRNYRTNVKGDLLTAGGTWTAKIDTIWNRPDIVKVVEVADIKSANEIINQYASTTKQLEVKFTGEPNDSGKPEGEAAGKRAIVTTPIQQDGSLSIEVLAETKELYVGDYPDEYTVTSIDTENAKPAVVNINVPESSSIVELVINAPSKSVYINGKEVSNVGTITSLDAITSQNTLIIEKNQTVGTLTIRQGGLEIHGTVGQAVVPEGHGTIVVRDCENLKETEVYGVLKEYIAEGYVGVKGRTTADLWDIVPVVCKIGTKSYGTLIDAVDAVQSGETINLVRDYEGDGVVVPGGKNFTLDFGGHTYKVIGNMAGSAGTQNQCFQLLKGSTLVFQNGTITTSCAKLGINAYSDVTIKNVTIDMSQTEATGQVACVETCNGTVSIEGESNLITKEDQIATLVLYWPNGGYGDIDVTLNTTGEVNGLMAYGSYQVQDLSTVAQHSHVTIKDGKYDCTFDMDGLESYDYVISGGVFANKPDDSFAPRGCAFVANTDAMTKDKYPWKVGPKSLPGSGTVDDPYQIASAEDLCSMAAYSPYTNFKLTSDIEASAQDYTKAGTYFGKGIMKQLSGVFDGNGHTITFPEGDESFYICSVLYKGTIKNLNVVFPEEGSLVEIAYNNSKFENVNVGGKLLHFSGNCAAYVTYAYYDVTFENCTCSADITGVGGVNDYNAVFVGYSVSDEGPFVFKNCKYTGKMVCGTSSMFLANPNSRKIIMNVENCSNEGSITSTYVGAGYKMNYYYSNTSNNYDSFTLNDVSHPGVASNGGQSWVPVCWEDQLVSGNGTAFNGPVDCGIVLSKTQEGNFSFTPATNGKIGGVAVAKYTVFSGLYVGVSGGSSRFFATEDIVPDGSTSYETNMKDYKFVDHTYVNGGTITKIGDNDTFTDATGTYYVVNSDEQTGGHQPEAATIHYVAAYDQEGRLLASASLE